MRIVVTGSNGRQAQYHADAQRPWYVLKNELVYYDVDLDEWRNVDTPIAPTRTFGLCTNDGQRRTLMSASPLPPQLIPAGLRRGYNSTVALMVTMREDTNDREWEADDTEHNHDAVRAFVREERAKYVAQKRSNAASKTPASKRRK